MNQAEGLVVCCAALIPALALPSAGQNSAKTSGKLSVANAPYFADDFSAGLGNWVWEGDGAYQVKAAHGRLVIQPDSRSYGGVNVWCKKKMPADFRLEFDYLPIKEKGNLVFIFSANLLNGKDLVAEHVKRNGHYVWITNGQGAFNYKKRYLAGKQVPPMACYTISYWFPGGRYPDVNRMPSRKNPGHLLLADAQHPARKSGGKKPYHFTIVKRGGHVTFLRDGVKVLDFRDPGRQQVQAITRRKDGRLEKEPYVMPVYGAGYLGLRSLHAWASFDNLKVFALQPSP